MARPAEPGRTALLDAGRRLLCDRACGSISTLSVNAVVAEAGMSKGAFFQHFPTRRDYIVTLHRRFHEVLQERIGAAIAAQPAGAGRLQAGVISYLDACLELSGTKAFLFQARAEVNLADEIAHQNDHFARLAVEDLEAIGWPDPEITARLLIAAVAEAALIEAASGRANDRLRRGVIALATPCEG